MSDQRIVGDRYRLSSRLGRGGTAGVWFGLDTRLCRPVAVKLLRPELAEDPEARALFRREARFVGGLQHPHVVAVYDAGETVDPGTGASLPYLVLEYVPGQTLQSLMAAGRALGPTRALRITRDLLDALSYCHAAGVVHHDIKPANIILAPDGGVKLMDFGIARLLADGPTGAAPAGAVRGTAKYMAPERLRGGSGDARADLYSVGVLLYQLVVGRPPFVGDEASVLHQQLHAGPVTPSVLNPALGPDLDAVLQTALAKAPADRYGSAAEMRAAVQGILERGGTSGARTAAVAAADVPGVVAPAGRARRRAIAVLGGAPRRRALVAAGVAAALVPVAGLVARTGDFGGEPVQASVSTVGSSAPEPVRTTEAVDESEVVEEVGGEGQVAPGSGRPGVRAPAAGPAPRASRPAGTAEVGAAAAPSRSTTTGRRVTAAPAVDSTTPPVPGPTTERGTRPEVAPARATKPAPEAKPKVSVQPRGDGSSAPRPAVEAPKPPKPWKPPEAEKPKAPEAEKPKAPEAEEPKASKPPKAEKVKPPKPEKSKPPKAEKTKPPKAEKDKPKKDKPEKTEKDSGSGTSGRDSDSGKRDRGSEQD